jgi:hypothetical protein
MAKKMTRRKTNRPKLSTTRLRELAARREIESGIRHHRKIKRLAGELRRAIFNADDALRMIGRIAWERDMPTASSLRDPNEDKEPATAGAGLDARD